MSDKRQQTKNSTAANRRQGLGEAKSKTADRQDRAAALMILAQDAAKSFHYDQAIEHLSEIEEIWNTEPALQVSAKLRAELHQSRGAALAKQGKLQPAIEEYQLVLEHCRDRGQLRIRAETFLQIGQLLAKQGEHDRALGFLQRAIGAYRRLGDSDGTCRALRNLGVLYVDLGEFEEAEENFGQAIELAQEIGNKVLYADLVNNLGTIMNMKGNRPRALELYAEALELYRGNNEIRKAGYTENNIGITYTDEEDYSRALEYFEQAYRTAQQVKDAALALLIDLNLAELFLYEGALEKAKAHCRAAEKHLNDARLVNGALAETYKILGKIAQEEKQWEIAGDYFDRALEIARQIHAQFVEAEVLLGRGSLHAATKRHYDALNDLEGSYHIYRTVKAEGRRAQTEKIIGSIEKLYLAIFDAMAKEVDRKDKYTKGHSDRVASLALLLAKELGMKPFALKTIVAGALLHDLGKVRVPDEVLKKAGKLTQEEFQGIRKHPELGLEILEGKEFPWEIFPLILHHHERYDGRGYPNGLKGEETPLGARIVGIADVFDALTSDRIYRSAYDTEKALTIMLSESGTAFDPALFKTFDAMVREGKADLVINSRTRDDEMFSIWSKCM